MISTYWFQFRFQFLFKITETRSQWTEYCLFVLGWSLTTYLVLIYQVFWMKVELKYIYMSNISMLYYSYIRQKFSLLSSSFGFRISEKRIYRTDSIAIAFPCRKRNFIDVDPLPCTLPHLKTFAYSLSFFFAHKYSRAGSRHKRIHDSYAQRVCQRGRGWWGMSPCSKGRPTV